MENGLRIWIGVLPSPQAYGFYIFSWKFAKKASEIQVFRILVPLVDFTLKFYIGNLRPKAFKKLWENSRENLYV
jgi:hypothetical protein